MEDLNPNTIKANELRIGNLIYNSYTQDVFSVYSMFIVQFLKTEDTNIKPVLLTEEWLYKFGFKKDIWTDRGLIIGHWWNNGVILITSEFRLDGQEDMKPLKYVHRLQNLYFALTGEELILKEEN